MSFPLLTYAQALEKISESLSPLPSRSVHWRELLGLTLAEDLYAQEPYPPFDNSAVDGYAVRVEDLFTTMPDLPVALPVQEEIFAGKNLPRSPMRSGFAVQIMTGAPIPDGADAVVMVEDTRREGDCVSIFHPISQGANIRRKGEEISRGALLLSAGSPIGSVEQGLLALQGIHDASVRLNPVVAVLATGDELVEPEEPAEGGQIRNTNTYTLTAELSRYGCEIINLGIGRDDKSELRALLEQGLDEADVLLTTGGVSAGEKDYIPALLEELGMKKIFHKVAVKPGKPLLFGKRGEKVIFGLPGNVVSVMSSFHLFVKPALRRLAGRAEWQNPVWYARIGKTMSNPGGRTHFIRCTLSHSPMGLPIAFPTGQQGSGMLTSMRGADGFAVIPSDLEQVEEFAVVEFVPIQPVL